MFVAIAVIHDAATTFRVSTTCSVLLLLGLHLATLIPIVTE